MNSQTFSAAATLLERVRNGNDWCLRAWARACDAADDHDEWCRRMDLFWRGTVKLDSLNFQLEGEGYDQCLYDEPKCRGTDDITCLACPSKTPHWRKVVTA